MNMGRYLQWTNYECLHEMMKQLILLEVKMPRKRMFSQAILLVLSIALVGCSIPVGSTGSPADVFEIGVVEVNQSDNLESVIEEIKPVLVAMLGYGDRKGLVQYISTGCTHADGLGGPPKCEPGQAEGTIVEVFPVLGGEGTYATSETIDRTLEFMVKDLYAVYRPEPRPEPVDYSPTGEYALLFDREMNDIPFPITALVQDGKLAMLIFTFGGDPTQMLSGIPLDQILITPEQANAVAQDVLRSEGHIP
jgi:hypothetical protein